MRLIGSVLVVAFLVLIGVPAQSAPPEAAGGAVVMAQATEPPQAQPPTTRERLEGDLPQEPVLHEGNRLLYGFIVLVVVFSIVAGLAWAFRSGRQNRPASGRKEKE
jgi:hypothetical protein